MSVDSRWRKLTTLGDGNVALANPEPGTVIGTEQASTREAIPVFTVSPMMQYLVKAF